MYSCQKILTNNSRNVCLCFPVFSFFFKATNRKRFRLSGMGIKIKAQAFIKIKPKLPLLPKRQIRKGMAFQVLWAAVPSSKRRVVQGSWQSLVLPPALPGKHGIAECGPPWPFSLLATRVYAGTARVLLLRPGILLERAQQNNCTRCEESGARLWPWVSEGPESSGTFQIALSPPRAFSSCTWRIRSTFWALALPVPFFISISQHVCSEQLSYVMILMN